MAVFLLLSEAFCFRLRRGNAFEMAVPVSFSTDSMHRTSLILRRRQAGFKAIEARSSDVRELFRKVEGQKGVARTITLVLQASHYRHIVRNMTDRAPPDSKRGSRIPGRTLSGRYPKRSPTASTFRAFRGRCGRSCFVLKTSLSVSKCLYCL